MSLEAKIEALTSALADNTAVLSQVVALANRQATNDNVEGKPAGEEKATSRRGGATPAEKPAEKPAEEVNEEPEPTPRRGRRGKAATPAAPEKEEKKPSRITNKALRDLVTDFLAVEDDDIRAFREEIVTIITKFHGEGAERLKDIPEGVRTKSAYADMEKVNNLQPSREDEECDELQFVWDMEDHLVGSR